jgi:hypothetical protein
MRKLTRKDLEDAPMFTIFWVSDEKAGDVEYSGMRPDQVIESDEGGPQDTGVIEQLLQRKVTIGLHVERDDELCAGTAFDDLDAALAHLRYNENPIVKVPDRLTASSRHFKFYVVERIGW